MALFVNKHMGRYKDDEFYTLKETWEKIKDYIPKDKIIWEAFSNGEFEAITYLREICKEVISNTGNFFEANHGEVVLTNPPFSVKREVLVRLKELDKPFICILPTLALQTKYIQDIFKGELQIILPSKKIFFYKMVDGEKKVYDKLSFYCCYVCYKMNLPKDLIFV